MSPERHNINVISWRCVICMIHKCKSFSHSVKTTGVDHTAVLADSNYEVSGWYACLHERHFSCKVIISFMLFKRMELLVQEAFTSTTTASTAMVIMDTPEDMVMVMDIILDMVTVMDTTPDMATVMDITLDMVMVGWISFDSSLSQAGVSHTSAHSSCQMFTIRVNISWWDRWYLKDNSLQSLHVATVCYFFCYDLDVISRSWNSWWIWTWSRTQQLRQPWWTFHPCRLQVRNL